MWQTRFEKSLRRGAWGALAAATLLAASWTTPVGAQPPQADPNAPVVNQQEDRKDGHVKQDPPREQPGRVDTLPTPQAGPNGRNRGDNAPIESPRNNPQQNGGPRYQAPEQRDNPNIGRQDGRQQQYQPPDQQQVVPQGGASNRYRSQPIDRNQGDQSDNRGLPQTYRRPGNQGVLAPPDNNSNAGWQRGRQRTGSPDQGPTVQPMPPIQRRAPSGEVRRTVPIDRVTPTPKPEIELGHSQALRAFGDRIRQRNQNVSPAMRRIPAEKLVVRRPDGRRDQAVVIDRSQNTYINRNYTNIRNRFGSPGFGFRYLPRPVWAYQQGYRDGFRDGRHFGTRWNNHRPVFLFFYSNFYFDDPYFGGFSYPGYYPNIYFYFGWMPRWCRAPSIVVLQYDPYPVYYGTYSTGPAYYYDRGFQLDENGVDQAMADIRRAWLDADIDRFSYHLREGEKISVYFDTDYSYSLSDQDYYSMTLDAMSTIDTISMEFDEPTWINSNEVFFTGRHVFNDPDGDRQTVYVSYRLHRYGGRWYIIGVGSSPNPIATPYDDFRYRNRY